MKKYYEILEVNEKASKEVIEKAYKVLAKKYHPDLYTASKKIYADQKIKEINEAYQILSDDFLREQYDNELYKQNQSKYQKDYEEKAKVKVNKEKHTNQENRKKDTDNYKVGSLGSLIGLTKELFSNRPKTKEKKQITKIDIIALIITIIVVLIIGVILWFIPFTNGWMRELLFENPIFSWIGNIFFK